ncbi:tyrosine-type recombinase/integrase [Bremerella sp. T1]|uniref:tyrosine-type recombinase/integrase n=1 Tax=Bremerella sp. TYQ1 TaxID=3119568 RepID=UPI001CCF94BD|nr:tyrosine-type recombinase/integrase [Bremerella volcania]UBM38382.1 site-specific integrase [Bremerella volcania]
MNYYEYCKKTGIKLELSPHRGKTWKKFHKGKYYYFSHPTTKAGYELALEEWILTKAQKDGQREHAQQINRLLPHFQKVIHYYSVMGCPKNEQRLRQQVVEFISMLEELLSLPKADVRNDCVNFAWDNLEFLNEFVDSGLLRFQVSQGGYKLSDKWLDRLEKMAPQEADKLPQTIDYWLQAYLGRTENRVNRTIKKNTSNDRAAKLKPLEKYTDKLAHVSHLNGAFVESYHSYLDDLKAVKTAKKGEKPKPGKELAKSTKEGYFKAFRMFCRWLDRQAGCEYDKPKNLDDREYVFREPAGQGRKRMKRKTLLWINEEVDQALEQFPETYGCFLLLMLNCGFRHSDISNLRHDDLDLENGRLIYQREKLNQQLTAPVVNYKLWAKTIAAIREAKSDDPVYVFRNASGGPVEDSMKSWWKRWQRANADNPLASKRWDYLRKTGSTIVARYDNGLDEIYLAESLSTTAKIHYTFTDGEPCEKLDKAIAYLGSEFGFCDPPAKTIELTPEIVKALAKAKIKV